jgi:hypothetical protein
MRERHQSRARFGIDCGSPVNTSTGMASWFLQPMACGDKESVKAEDLSKLCLI